MRLQRKVYLDGMIQELEARDYGAGIVFEVEDARMRQELVEFARDLPEEERAYLFNKAGIDGEPEDEDLHLCLSCGAPLNGYELAYGRTELCLICEPAAEYESSDAADGLVLRVEV